MPRVSGMGSGGMPRVRKQHHKEHHGPQGGCAQVERGAGPCTAGPRLFLPAQVRARCRRAPAARQAGPGLGTLAPWVERPLRATHGPGRGGRGTACAEKTRVTACTAYSKWDFQGEVAGSANSPTDKAYLRTGVLVPMLCFYCQWDTAELDVPGAGDRQPCPHTALMEQGPRPLPDPWEFGYTSGPKHSIFIVL